MLHDILLIDISWNAKDQNECMRTRRCESDASFNFCLNVFINLCCVKYTWGIHDENLAVETFSRFLQTFICDRWRTQRRIEVFYSKNCISSCTFSRSSFTNEYNSNFVFNDYLKKKKDEINQYNLYQIVSKLKGKLLNKQTICHKLLK